MKFPNLPFLYIELNIEYGGWVPKGRKASKVSGIYDVVKDKIMQVLK